MCHYIADATFYSHLIDSADISRLTRCLGRVNVLTSRKYSDWPPPTDRGGSFLSIDSARAQFSSDMIENAYMATQCAGWDTFSGDAYNLPDVGFASINRAYIKDAAWLNQHYIPEIIPDDYSQYWNWRADDWSSFPSGTDEYAYLKTIEHNLNVAIFYTAAAMNEVMNYYEGCECKKTERGEDGNEISGKYLQYNALFAMLTVSSLVTSIFAISWFGLSSKSK